MGCFAFNLGFGGNVFYADGDRRQYTSSVVQLGEATGVVLTTGKATFFGKTTHLVQSARPKLHIEEIITKVVRRLFVIVAVLLLIMLAVVVYRHLSVVATLPLVLVVLLSAVPVALPVMLTVATTFGAKELVSQGVLVTHLSASEDAAMVLEIAMLMFIGIHYFALRPGESTLNTFSFLSLFFFAIFSLFVVRQDGHFWQSRPSSTLGGVIAADTIIASMIGVFGLSDLPGIRWPILLFIVAYSLLFFLGVNDFSR